MLTRRAMLRDGAALGVALFVARDGSVFAVEVDEQAKFLEGGEFETLRALVDRFVPGRPEDVDEGAVAAGCAEGIDALLGAFRTRPPRIYAGAPFSDRAGSPVNHFARFVRLDRYEAKAWRLRIEGSKGKRKLEFNGPVKGYQRIYRDGLAALDRAAGPTGFAALPGPGRDAVLRSADDPAITELLDISFLHTLEMMYGAPEYGGNRGLIGWEYTDYAGDVQPRGWTREEVEAPAERDPTAALPDLTATGMSRSELFGLAALASPEFAHGLVARSGDRLSTLRAELAPVLAEVKRRSADGA